LRSTPRSNRVLGEYAIVAPLGRGGVANVYLGEHASTRERVALKILDASHRNHAEMGPRLLAEHAILSRVRHAGVIETRGASCGVDGLPYVVLEYVDGENLGTRMARGRLELGAVIAIATQVASALAALHVAGITHCDLKPDNIVVLHETGFAGWPRIKVIDFGVARTVDDPDDAAPMVAGTPSYMAPEQWTGRPVLRSDVYGLGCMLFELCTGDVPFSGSLPELMTKHTDALPPRPSALRSTIPTALERLIMRMLAKDPAMRPPMSEVCGALASIAIDGEWQPLEAAG
jgi:serine/threonine-protein kinase